MRIEAIEPGTRSALAELEQQIQAERGRISPLYQVLLHSPAIAKGWEQMLSAVRNYSSIDAGLRELIILRVAMLNQAAYEFDAHVPHALKAGVTQTAIDATRDTGTTGDPGLLSAASACLARAETGCDDHALLALSLAPGERREGIDINDWYYDPATFPPPMPPLDETGE